MVITYRDELGIVAEIVDEYGITSDGTVFYFNDKRVAVSSVVAIQEGSEL